MYAPIGIKEDQVLSATSEVLAPPAGIGSKQLVYLVASNQTGANVALTATGTAFESGFVIPHKEVALIGPILGADLTKWGAYAATPATGFDITYVAGDVRVDTGTATSPFGSTPAPALTYSTIYTSP